MLDESRSQFWKAPYWEMEVDQIKRLHLFHYDLKDLLIDFFGVLQNMDEVVHSLVKTIIHKVRHYNPNTFENLIAGMHGGRAFEENRLRANQPKSSNWPKWVEIELKGEGVINFTCSSKTHLEIRDDFYQHYLLQHLTQKTFQRSRKKWKKEFTIVLFLMIILLILRSKMINIPREW